MILSCSPPRRTPRIDAAVFAAILTIGVTACGGSQFPDSSHSTRANPSAAGGSSPVNDTPASDPTDPPTSVRPKSAPTTTRPTTTTPTTTTRTPAPAPAPTDVSLRSLVPTVGTLGTQWTDDGESASSRDLEYPPLDCAPYTRVFDERRDSLIHEFSFLASADGNYEQGHIAMLAISGASTDAVSRELAAVLRSSFASCAAGTAVNWFNDHGEGTIASVSPRVVSLPVGGSAVIWRVTITGQSTDGAAITFFMDIAYLTRGFTLVKVRIATCPCRPPVAGDAELLPGEVGALRSITLRLGAAGAVDPAPAPAPTASGPTNLN